MGVRLPRHIGPYYVERRLSNGGMGVVVYGRHMMLGREAAIKLRPRCPEDPEDERMAERFRQGAILQSEFDHPHICRVYDCLESQTHQALVLEYLGGGSVEDALRDAHGPLEISFALDLCLRAASALTLVHEHGVIHRDIKPGNLMLRVKGDASTLRLTDFGVAKCVGRSPDITVSGANVGTLWYMPPEQFNGEAPSSLVDVYALGATLYEMLTGHIPFREAESTEIFKRFLDQEPPPPLRESNPNVSPELAAIVEAALDLQPAHRLPSMRAFSCLLQSVARNEIITSDALEMRHFMASEEGAFLRHYVSHIIPQPIGEHLLSALDGLDHRLNPQPISVAGSFEEDDDDDPTADNAFDAELLDLDDLVDDELEDGDSGRFTPSSVILTGSSIAFSMDGLDSLPNHQNSESLKSFEMPEEEKPAEIIEEPNIELSASSISGLLFPHESFVSPTISTAALNSRSDSSQDDSHSGTPSSSL